MESREYSITFHLKTSTDPTKKRITMRTVIGEKTGQHGFESIGASSLKKPFTLTYTPYRYCTVEGRFRFAINHVDRKEDENSSHVMRRDNIVGVLMSFEFLMIVDQ